MTNSEKFRKLLLDTKRDGIDTLLVMMESMGFFEAPCSGGNHLCKKGGLLEHSLNVYEYAHELAKSWLEPTEYEAMKDSITIAALLHDLGKVGDYGKPMYVPNYLKTGTVSATKPFKRNKNLSPIPHSVRSAVIARSVCEISEDEEWAIVNHDGLYAEMKYSIQGHETPLFCIIHYADFWVAHFVEGTDGESDE